MNKQSLMFHNKQSLFYNKQSLFYNKFIVFSLVITFFVLVIVPLLATFAIKIIPGGVQPSLGNTVKIYDQFVYSQAFISPDDNLTGIGTSIKNPNFANKRKAFMNLYDDQNKLVREVTLNGANIADGKFVKVLFDPIMDSKGKRYTWTMHSFDSTFEDALELFITDDKPLWSLEFKVNERIEKDGISYVTLHRPKNKTEVLQRVTGEWVNKIKGDKVFFVIYFLIILTLAALVVAPNLNNRIRKD